MATVLENIDRELAAARDRYLHAVWAHGHDSPDAKAEMRAVDRLLEHRLRTTSKTSL